MISVHRVWSFWKYKEHGFFMLLLGLCRLDALSASDRLVVKQINFPDALVSYMAAMEIIKKTEVRPLSGGTLSWPGGFIAAASIKEYMEKCSIYVSTDGVMSKLFTHHGCTFKGKPWLSFQRGGSVPDIVYEILVNPAQVHVLENERAAFFFDPDQNTYCRSRRLEVWYLSGSKGEAPELSDAKCFSRD